jgi:hypothetical protein
MTYRLHALPMAALIALLSLCRIAPASADFIESCPAPTGQVYGFTCANTSNTEDGTQLVVSNGQVIAGTTGLTSFETTNLGTVTPGAAILRGHFGLGTTTGWARPPLKARNCREQAR